MALLQFTVPSLLGQDAGRLLEVFGGTGSSAARSREDALVASQRVARAKRIMAPFVLRRKKSQARPLRVPTAQNTRLGVDGAAHDVGGPSWGRAGPALCVLDVQVLNQLPPKTDRVQYCPMPERQAAVYSTLIRESQERIGTDEAISGGHVVAPRLSERYAPVVCAAERNVAGQANNMMMQLRKAANHPCLLRVHYTDEMLATMAKLIRRVQTGAWGLGLGGGGGEGLDEDEGEGGAGRGRGRG